MAGSGVRYVYIINYGFGLCVLVIKDLILDGLGVQRVFKIKCRVL